MRVEGWVFFFAFLFISQKTWYSSNVDFLDLVRDFNAVLQPVVVASSLLVFPNPTSGDVTLSYNFGSDYQKKMLSVYGAMGRKIQNTLPENWHGIWALNTNIWAPGVYIICMEGDGQVLQMQRMKVLGR